MNLNKNTLEILSEATQHLQNGFKTQTQESSYQNLDEMQLVLNQVAEKLHDNYPYHDVTYIGQMLKPPHPVAHLAYTLAMNLNPNNHALDGGRASSAMEKEAVSDIAAMFGWKNFLGHLCGGGTMANFEALWIARQIAGPKKTVLASEQSHYTHSRLSAVLGCRYESLPSNDVGAMDVAALESRLEQGDVGTVVVTLGTTLCGAVDALPKVLALKDRHDFRVHVDTAYGGYFTLAENLDPHARLAFDAIGEADSIVIDPHKHGLQPYGCGCVLFKDPEVGKFYQHDSPYTYFTSKELHLGEISLECSRAGASAVALWATQKLLPLNRGGQFASDLQQCRQAALELYQWLHEQPGFTPLFGPQLDIVCWAVDADSASVSSLKAQEVFDRAASEHDLHLAVASIPRHMCAAVQSIQTWDQDSLTCLRACVMKPEHLSALKGIQNKLALSLENN